MKQSEQLLPLLPEVYAGQLEEADFQTLEELRLGVGRPLRLRDSRGERELWPAADRAMVETVLGRACHHSVYAYAETLRQGYVTVEGGHRIGVCGFGVRDGDAVRTIRSPSSLNIRVARQAPGCANDLVRRLTDSALLLGPPGSGKTTLLRDTVRQLSDRLGQTVGLADERGELSAMEDGEAQLQIGRRTDVLINVPKAAAVLQLLRTMNPDWIALDEITDPTDLTALDRAAYCGVRLLATAHGLDRTDLQRRPLYRRLLQLGVFRQLVILKRDKSYSIEEVGR